ncbi:MAG: hypothetical protein KGI57_06670, partial [Hyphomicrobiales bacterium]|nr:hypothetical protein [Hyphomicrobiales bacterium]
MTLRLAPEILDAIDVIARVDEGLGMVDPFVAELRYVERVVAREAVGIDDAVGFDLAANDRNRLVSSGVRDDDGVHLAAALEETEHRNLAGDAAPALAFSRAAEMALVDLERAEPDHRVADRGSVGALHQLLELLARHRAVPFGGGEPLGQRLLGVLAHEAVVAAVDGGHVVRPVEGAQADLRFFCLYWSAT